MIDRTTKLRWRRRIRRRKRQVEDIGFQTEEQFERHFFRRLTRLFEVRRFVFSWIVLFILLIAGSVVQTLKLSPYYQKLVPAAGGTFSEGILGAFTNINPLYATGPVDSAASRLVFSSLFTYDRQNQLVGDLVDKWSVDDRGIQYTLHLKQNVKWHDGKPLTADDVLFTYQTIQNPDAKSPFFNGWQGIKMEAKDDTTIIFTLPNVLSSFPYALTNGIVPKHILDGTPPSQLRSVRFNSVSPIGSGAFKWDRIEVAGNTPDSREEQIGLVPNPSYYREKPKLQHFIIRSFKDENHMLDSFQRGELNAMAGLATVPDTIQKQPESHEYDIPLTGEVMVFFKTTQPNLTDVAVRQALVQAVDTPSIVRGLGYPAIGAHEPLLQNMFGYDKALTQLPFNTDQANKLLDQAGWNKGTDDIRRKGDKPLTFRLYSQSTSEYAYVTGELQKAWHKVGIDAQVVLQDDSDLQTTVNHHDYDALLYGISLGTDPDVFAYWHSSQADPRAPSRLNLSEYRSGIADKALEAGRTRSDATLRAIKYRPFLEAWRNDAPALALYQPRFVYVTHGTLFNFDPTVLNSATDRYNNVANWMIRQAKVTK
jgi:peptide/nickel transport system substrate-binding protein